MTEVLILTSEQKKLLQGQEITTDVFFSPTEDANGNFFISIEEIEQCDNEEFVWIKDRKDYPLSTLVPKVVIKK